MLIYECVELSCEVEFEARDQKRLSSVMREHASACSLERATRELRALSRRLVASSQQTGYDVAAFACPSLAGGGRG